MSERLRRWETLTVFVAILIYGEVGVLLASALGRAWGAIITGVLVVLGYLLIRLLARRKP